MQKNDQVGVTDERKVPYTILENGIIDSMSFQKPIDKLLYISLCRFSHMKQIFPSIGKLMLMCGISSPNTLKAALERIESIGLIKVRNRGRKANGEHETHEYILKDVPASILENSAFKDEKVQEKKENLKMARKEKSKNTKHNAHIKARKNEGEKSASKFDVPQSKFDGGLSNFDGGSSNFEQENQEFSNQEFTNQEFKNKNLSIIEEIQKLDIPAPVFEVLKKKSDRLIDSEIDLYIVELVFKEFRDTVDQYKFAKILFSVLSNRFDDFQAYLTVSVERYIQNRNKLLASVQKKTRVEIVPDRFKELDFSKGRKGSTDQPDGHTGGPDSTEGFNEVDLLEMAFLRHGLGNATEEDKMILKVKGYNPEVKSLEAEYKAFKQSSGLRKTS